ncbi:MAG: hypothetical protein JWP44_4504 [Mucilaginibacter sp.]|nr:hypothetical protein [Mucilaginibacter sp.]
MSDETTPLKGAIDRTCISYWFPVIEANGIPVPKTRVIRTDAPLWNLLDGEPVPGLDAFLEQLRGAIKDVGGPPAFLRTGHTSGKHDWRRTCYYAGEHLLEYHVFCLVEYSHLVDLMGLPTDVWVARELLPTEPAFIAFNGMPITRERRYFVRNGVIIDHHPYWPPNAFDRTEITVPDWQDRLAAISQESPEEVQELTDLSTRVSRLLDGFWSVDWLWVPSRGWICTDMAEGDRSWHWTREEREGLAG